MMFKAKVFIARVAKTIYVAKKPFRAKKKLMLKIGPVTPVGIFGKKWH